MILTVDIGNTTISLCGAERCADADYNIVFSKKLDTVKNADEFYYHSLISACLDDVLPELEGAILSSVVPSLTQPIYDSIASLLHCCPMLLTSELDLGFSSGVKDLSRVGADRLADSAWAATRYPLPVITVDLGTATTFNVIDENHVFRGGAITPGIETSLNALTAQASLLPEIELKTPSHSIGRDTVECMLSGAVLGAAAMVDGLAAAFEHELGQKASLVLTGGLYAYASPLCRHVHFCDPLLLPKGMAYLFDRNRK